MLKHVWAGKVLILLALFFSVSCVLEMEALARVGGGMSSGSRGSRTYSTPRTATPPPSQPYSGPAKPSLGQPMPQGGFLRGLAGGLVGGMIGGMLFRSLGFAGGPGMDGGIGVMDIVLIALLLYGIYWFVRKRRSAQETGAYTRESSTFGSAQMQDAAVPGRMEGDLEKGLGYVRQIDPYFDEKKFLDLSMDSFFRIQGAWTNRDMASVRSLLTEEMSQVLQGDAERLTAAHRTNKLDNIAVRSADITEAWQEGGQDFITVRFLASLLDFTVDDRTGGVVEGSRTDPVKFEEYWTFTRPVGSGAWQLSAITQAP